MHGSSPHSAAFPHIFPGIAMACKKFQESGLRADWTLEDAEKKWSCSTELHGGSAVKKQGMLRDPLQLSSWEY